MNTPWTAGYLPGIAADEVAWHDLACGSLAVRVPVLTPAQLQALCTRVKGAAQRHLRPLPVKYPEINWQKR